MTLNLNHKRIRILFITITAILFTGITSSAGDGSCYISEENGEGYFPLSANGKSTVLYASSDDYQGVLKVMQMFRTDIKNVTGTEPEIIMDNPPKTNEILIIGTLGKSSVINELIENDKLDITGLEGKWEKYIITTIEKPVKGVKRALVIVGSDKRGTIYGMFDISERIGVSPWYWWADVPIKQKTDIYIKPGIHTAGEPAVKYRGIFLNDEEPALGRWAVENYNGFTHEFYEKLFELLLRLKGNYLWPAMWWASFNSDDTLNPVLANEYGIVMGTTHHEPMMRAHAEWKKRNGGAWNYETNAGELREFWKEGIERMGDKESIITLAMRGDGDEAMSEETNISLLEKIVADQRKIIADVTGKNVTTIPQLWALYKEVQDYYDKGMQVPDDVTLLLCDDNWGNIRRLPEPDASPRKGGYGMYYHFDFVGGPVSYKWLNTSPIPRIWEQMNLCYRYGVDRIWLVNVGDLKPMELPISFFLDFAWNPDDIPAELIPEYTKDWAKQQFGDEYAEEIAEILIRYTKYNGRRTPEMLSPDIYSLVNYREFETVVKDYREIETKAQKIYDTLPEHYKDAFYQLVLHPVKACANLNKLYYKTALNRLYAEQKRAKTNDLAEKVKKLFEKDLLITEYYHNELADGKWNHMMAQTHIGYTSWNQPNKNHMPKVKTINIPNKAKMGVAVEGSDICWNNGEAELPAFDRYNKQEYYIEIFNKGIMPFDYEIIPGKEWLTVSDKKGNIEKQKRIFVSINWEKVPKGTNSAKLEIKGPEEKTVHVNAVILNPESPDPEKVEGFIEQNGYVSIEAEHFTGIKETEDIKWLVIPDLSRTLSGITPVPVTAANQTVNNNSPCLEYKMYLFSAGEVNVNVYVCPTQDFNATGGLRYAISFDDEPPQIVNINELDTIPDWKYPEEWNEAVTRKIKIKRSVHEIKEPGEHILKFRMVDPGIVMQKIVVETGEVKPSYLGPPESFYKAE